LLANRQAFGETVPPLTLDEGEEAEESAQACPEGKQNITKYKKKPVDLTCSLNGIVSRDFRTSVFCVKRTPSHGLNQFRVWLSFRRDIRFKRCQKYK
jgi:hypothetical protein